jgi:hypothetical protein
MLVHSRTGAVARIAAALVAVTLSGAPRVLAMNAPVEGHRCSCKAHAGGHHECECAICRKAALSAHASDRNVPPCHRAAARKALARDESARREGAPCIEGTCGTGGRPVVTIAGVEPFCPPPGDALAGLLAREERRQSSPRLLDRAHDPETPPPRAA